MTVSNAAETREQQDLDVEGAVSRLKGVRVILGRLAISTEQAGDRDEDHMLGLLEETMLDSISVIETALDTTEDVAVNDSQKGRVTELQSIVDSYMEAEGITEGELAERIGIDEDALISELAGRTPLYLDESIRLAELLGISIDELAARSQSVLTDSTGN